MHVERYLLRILIFVVAVLQSTFNSPALERASNNTLKMPLAPAFPGYSLKDSYGDLNFSRPVTITSPPGESNRLFVVERAGRIIAITNLSVPTKTVFLDLTAQTSSFYVETGMFGLAFHPGFATNGFFYVYRTLFAGEIGRASC